jgi:hypothetical protein
VGASGFGLLLLLLAAAGCGPGQGTVSGRVLYDGAPLHGGWVTFRPADPRQNSVPARIEADGSYSAVLPAGAVTVSVDNRNLEPQIPSPPPPLPKLSPEALKALGNPTPGKAAPAAGGGGPDKPSGKYVKLPSRYYDVDTSGLDFTVAGGGQQHDIELTK